MFYSKDDNAQPRNISDTREDNQTMVQMLIPENELSAVDEGEDETQLELHDYVNLQECHDMMNMHQTLFDYTLSNPSQQGQKYTENNITNNDPSANFSSGPFCNSCKNV